MKVLFKQKGASLDIDILASDEAQEFITTHASTLDSSFRQVAMTDTMRRRLQRSDYIFSGIKTFHELNEAFPSLLDENGNRKPFEQFLNDVQKIDKTYNQNYLRAEYNFVQSSAEMAAKWEQYAEDGDRYYLQYRTAGDEKVRPAHAELNGITLPQSDSFWESYYPPNGWNCRCTVVQVRKSKYPETPHDEAMARGESALEDDKKGIFRFNSGKEEKTVPDYNAYTIRRCRDCIVAKGKGNIELAKEVKPLKNEFCEACQLTRKLEAKKERNRALFEKYKADKDYHDVEFNEVNGGVKATHIGHNFDSKKGWYEERVQDIGFRAGHVVILENEPQNLFKQRHTEGTWDGMKFEVAGTSKLDPKNVREALKHCASKPNSEVAVVFFEHKVSNETIAKGIEMFNGLAKLGDGQWKKFRKIVFMNEDGIISIS